MASPEYGQKPSWQEKVGTAAKWVIIGVFGIVILAEIIKAQITTLNAPILKTA